MTELLPTKPLGRKAYGHIPHLPGSRLGPGDHHVHAGQARICLEKPRDRHDIIIVQEKLDGSNVAVAKVNDQIVALGRAGYLAQTSKYEQHQLFAAWVRHHEGIFAEMLLEGERLCGEWLAQAHGTRYRVDQYPFIPFDLMQGETRLPAMMVHRRVAPWLPTPYTIMRRQGESCPLGDALLLLGTHGYHGACDPVEGLVYRVERKGEVDFVCKYVRPDKADGCYLPEQTGQVPVWNWRPKKGRDV